MGKVSIKEDFVKSVLEAETYQEMIASFFATLKENNPVWSYTVFAKKAGFKARSFPREVSLGQKKLTMSSLHKFIKGLDLKGDLAQAFQLQVFSQEPALDEKRRPVEKLQIELEKVRSRLKKRGRDGRKKISLDVQSQMCWRYVFAALGGHEVGANYQEVSHKIGLPGDECQGLLSKMLADGLIYFKPETNKYYPVESELFFERLSGMENRFSDFYCSTLDKIRKFAVKSFNQPESLFYSNVLSVRSDRFPQFKEELENLLDQYADRIGDDHGDSVVQVLTAMLPVRLL